MGKCFILEKKFDNKKEYYTYTLGNQTIEICMEAADLLTEKYGDNPRKKKENASSDDLLSKPLWVKEKSTGFFSSDKYHKIAEPLKSELLNNLEGFKKELLGKSKDKEASKDKKTEEYKKMYERVQKRWDDLFESLFTKIDGKATLKELQKYYDKMEDKIDGDIEELGHEYLAFDRDYYESKVHKVFDDDRYWDMVDPLVGLYWDNVLSEMPNDGGSMYKFMAKSNIKMQNEHGFDDETLTTNKIFEKNLERRVFDLDSKIKKTGNGRYYLGSNSSSNSEESKNENNDEEKSLESSENKDIKKSLESIKNFLDEGLISQEDYETTKNKLLKKLK